ncbi:MAG TPA: Xaa-Pro peptidase family protein [Syntrophorhabdaceae bacterium]|nr:Xaa-Pro peptidase family protein [Syntrophorhabdaceae bacterium]
MRENRIEKVLHVIGEAGLDACVLKGMDNIFYLTGFRGSEGTLVVTKGDVILLTDFRYITHAKEATRGIQVVEVRQKQNVFLDICQKYGIQRMGFDSFHVPYNLYQLLKEMLPDVSLIPLENSIEEIRQIKEPDEINAMVNAITIATDSFTEVLERIVPGRTEKEVASDLDYAMRRLGADNAAFQTIVASGPRSALPHAEPSDRPIALGDAVIIDFGVQVNGYCSDETCTVLMGPPKEEIGAIYTIVDEARRLGLAHAKAGVAIKDLDAIVRGYIGEKGYGEFFRHGVGHGVGIAVHEAPTISSNSQGLLEENMIVTIEPGIYLPNIGGVRLEDMVLITEEGASVLTRLRKDLFII